MVIICPTCGTGYETDKFRPLTSEPSKVKPGFVMVCLGCGDIFVFGQDLNIEVPSLSFMVGLSEDLHYQLEIIQRQIRAVRPLTAINNEQHRNRRTPNPPKR